MSHERLHPLIVCITETEKKTKKEVCIGKVFGSTIFEQVLDVTGKYKYALYEEMENQTWRLDATRLEHENLIPLQKTPLTHPPPPEEYESEERLYSSVKAFIQKHLDIPNPLGYDVLTAFTFSTWISELFDFTAYLGFYGREAVGKSRGLEVLQQLCFRAWLTTNLTTATLFRLTEKFAPTLLLDESEFLTAEDKKELIGLLNTGQRRGATIPRMKGEHFDEIEFFNVYCPKVIAGTEQLKRTTTSRMLVFTMTKNIRPIPRTIDKQEGEKLRGQLLMWRFRKISEMKNALTLEQKLAGRTELKATAQFPELEPLGGRMYELIYPLVYSAPTKEAKQNILEFAKEIERSKLQAEKTELSSIVFEAIINLKDTKVSRGALLVKDIAQYVNAAQPPQNWIPEKTIARKCRQMGFETTRTTRGVAILINQQLIDRLRKDTRYSTDLLNFNEPNEANEPNEPKKDSVGNWLDR
ncbi:hypothetical protein MUP77_15420 [Candidatus Bathyarchaeota archaeon]|nr:hypothetical protein [Candidatus Bathyarchaeota archaeon]